ncbi:hypothetical protein [Sphingomonas sp. NIC1]|uniref:hypothetical protein n=1 Tax=Sphingomonas sp. NIC1 TaxID=1961362 RepID=UPI00186581F7|nr:hypothetical protein [Sphingomonas sp. NIC1]
MTSNTTPIASLADEPGMQARGLIYDFLMARDPDRALMVTNMLPPSTDCATVDDGLSGVLEWLPELDSTVLAAYLARLQTTGAMARLCPNGLGAENAAAVWLKAGNDAKALNSAAASEKPLVLARTQSEIIARRLSAGDMKGARSLARTAAADPASLTSGSVFERAGAARMRVRLIHQLARLGEVREAEHLAAAYPGPGWRGFAYSVIVATTNRERAVPNWGGPFLDLTDVPADR